MVKEIVKLSPDTEMVSFDLWLTLIKSLKDEQGRTPFKDNRNEYMRTLFAPDMSFEVFDGIVREQDKAADNAAETRERDVLFDERVRMVASAVEAPEPSDDLLAALYEEQGRLFQAHHPLLIDKQTPEYLDRLKDSGLQLAVVSNTGYMHADQMRPLLDILGIGQKFDYRVFSNEVGFAKPHPRIYQTLIDQSGISAERITHVGDNARADVAGATAMGMRAIHMSGDITLKRIVEEVLL